MPLLQAWEQYNIYNFYVMTVLQIFVPFALLLLLNVSIVAVTKKLDFRLMSLFAGEYQNLVAAGSRTRLSGFADRRLAVWLRRQTSILVRSRA